MDTYSFLRQFADSWVLLAMTVFYIGAILWAFRPGSRALHKDIANIPFRDVRSPRNCKGTCASCKCKPGVSFLPDEVAK